MNCQTITGRVADVSTGEPLIYVSIGIPDVNRGTITDEQGMFHLETEGIPVDALIRFSMIGYESQTYFIGDLLYKENEIYLERKIYESWVVVVKPLGKPVKIGSSQKSPGIQCGWGGPDPGKGYEIGTKFELGDTLVKIKSLHLHLHKQSFDSTLFRLHIRNIVDNMPGIELPYGNIYFKVDKKSGWVEIDLSKYNLVFDGDIALSLEWIKAMGLSEEKLIKMNGQEQYTANVLFSLNKNQGCIYTRWGSEATWTRYDDRSPCFYLTVQ